MKNRIILVIEKAIPLICLLWFVAMCTSDKPSSTNVSENKEWFELVDQPGSYLALIGFDESSKDFYYGTNARDSKNIDLFYYNRATGESDIVFKNTMGFVLPEGNHYSKAISENKDIIILVAYLSNKHSNLYAYHRKVRSVRKLRIESDSVTLLTPVRFVGNELYYLSDYRSEFPRLYSYNFESESSRLLFEPNSQVEDVVPIDENEIAILLNENGSSRIAALNLKTLESREIFRTTGYVNPGTLTYSDSANVLIGEHSSPVEPSAKIHIRPDRHVHLSNDTAGNLRYDAITYSTEGHTIHGHFIWSSDMKDGDTPLVTFIHGGPEIQMPNSYNNFLVDLVNSGIAVFVPNIRGSAGFGKSFFHADDGAHDKVGPIDLKNGVDFILSKYSFIDSTRIFLNGLSYGGYVVYHTLIKYPTTFEGGIVVNGVVDYNIALGEMPDFFAPIVNMKLEEFKGPSLDYDIQGASLFKQGNKFRTKLLVFQGRKDELVPASAVDSLMKQLDSPNIAYIPIDESGHEISDPEMGKMITERSIEFILAN